MASRSSSQRSKQLYALRKINCAACRPIVSAGVVGFLVRIGKLPDRHHSDVEIDSAVTELLFELAGEKIFPRVRTIMRERWHPAGEQAECRE